MIRVIFTNANFLEVLLKIILSKIKCFKFLNLQQIIRLVFKSVNMLEAFLKTTLSTKVLNFQIQLHIICSLIFIHFFS